MSKLTSWPRWLVIDVLLAIFFAAADTGATLTGASWWPAHPGPLAWWLLGIQAAADLTLVSGDPASVKFCHRTGLTYVSCSPFRVPIARLAAAQAALEDKPKAKAKKK